MAEAHQRTKEPQSQLLALPAELRNKIYELSLPSTFMLNRETHISKTASSLPPLLNVCRKTRCEALGIWLADTLFKFFLLDDVKNFLEIIGPGNAAKLNHVRELYVFRSREDAEARRAWLQTQALGFGVREGVVECLWGRYDWFEYEKAFVCHGRRTGPGD
ncbi:Hypothetical predicted protein [Lecanosticta acicola]|uniref:2EXR domain-containing protein n=1 Tax=Lecanosticta acicola TaxID=111012 RepID=A0AAI8YU86_9PEZI|nr:Hypothetical predicted protein [Lecanosticta acicola]